MVGKASAAFSWPKPAVNNFGAAGAAPGFGWQKLLIFRIRIARFPAPAGQVY
jgi:hypothetical protein